MSNDSLEEKKKRLIGEIENLKRKGEKKRRVNSIIYSSLILIGIGLSAGAGLAGFLANDPKIPGVMALLAGILVSVESVFKFGEKRDFFRVVASEYYNLQVALRYRVDSEQKLRLIVDKFQIVNATSAKGVPRGKGMQATKLLYEGLDQKGILPVPEIPGMG